MAFAVCAAAVRYCLTYSRRAAGQFVLLLSQQYRTTSKSPRVNAFDDITKSAPLAAQTSLDCVVMNW